MKTINIDDNMIDALILGKINPFRSTSVGDPWQKTVDVKEINLKATRVVLETLDEVRSTRRSGMALLRGEVGVGKTHLLARLRKIAEDNNFVFVNVRPLGDITRIYIHFLQEIMVSLRKKEPGSKYSPLEQFIGEIIAQALDEGLPDNPVAKELAKSFSMNPMKIFEIDSKKLYSTNLRKIAANHIFASYNDVDIEFLEVLFSTLDPILRPTAMKWLNGVDVSEEDLEKLNVSSSISNEDKAIEIIQTIANLVNKPILLSFDQLESVHLRFKRENGIALFFDSLTNLYNQCPNILQVIMVQMQVWDVIEKELPEYSKQRIDYVADLEPLTVKSAMAIVAARMKMTYENSGIDPPYATYPFTEEYLKILVDNVEGNTRLVLRYLRDRLNELKDMGQIVEQTAEHIEKVKQTSAIPGIPSVTPTKIVINEDVSIPNLVEQLTGSDAQDDITPDPEDEILGLVEQLTGTDQQKNIPLSNKSSSHFKVNQPQKHSEDYTNQLSIFLERKWIKFAKEFEEEIYAYPHTIRRDFTKGVLYDILTEAINTKKKIFGVTILNVRIDQNLILDTKGLDLVFTYQTPRGPASVGIEINNSEHNATVFRGLRRLKKLVKGNIRYAFILRDEELSLQRTAVKTLELADSLADYGGLYYIDFQSNQALQATKKLLDFASAGDLTFEDYTIKRNDALDFIFRECLSRIKVFQSIFQLFQEGSNKGVEKSFAYNMESSEAVEAIITILKFNPEQNLERLSMLLNKGVDDLLPILEMLKVRGIISFDGMTIKLL